jgi:hypothetical protein
MVVVGLLLFGLLILGGLKFSPKGHAPTAPANVKLGVPARTLRFVAYDLARQPPGKDPLLAEIAKLNPDYLFLQGVNEDDSIEIAEMLGMQKSFHPQLYQRSEHLAGKKGIWGNLTLAKQSLYEGAPLGGIRGGFGGWAESVVDDHGFFVANLHLSPGDQGAAEAAEFEGICKSKGNPPMVVAVLASDAKPPAGLGFLSPVESPGGEYFFVTRDWKVIATGTASVSGGGLVPRWIDVARADEPTTQPGK